jgi:hypothetical protein
VTVHSTCLTHPCSRESTGVGYRTKCFADLLLEELTERCEEYRSHVAMVRRRMMLRPVVGIVRGAGAPIKLESLLADAAIPQPMETQIHGFGMFWLHPFVDDAFGGGIVNLNGGGRLFVSHFLL